MKFITSYSLMAVLCPTSILCASFKGRTGPEPQPVLLDYDEGFTNPAVGLTPVTPPGKPYKGFYMPGFTVSSNPNAPSSSNVAATSARSQAIVGGTPLLFVNSSSPYSCFDLSEGYFACGVASAEGELPVALSCDIRLEARDGNGNVRATKVVHYKPANPLKNPLDLPLPLLNLQLPSTIGLGNPLQPQPLMKVSFTDGCEPCGHCNGRDDCGGFKGMQELGFILAGTVPDIPAGKNVVVTIEGDSMKVLPYFN